MLVGSGWRAVLKKVDKYQLLEEPCDKEGRKHDKRSDHESEEEDSMKGEWYVSNREEGVIWYDANSLVLGIILEIGCVTVEDAAWLRKKNDYSHINVAELDAIMKEVDLALKWGLKVIEIRLIQQK